MELLTAYSMHSRKVNALACACGAGLSALAVWPCVFSVSGVIRVAVSVPAVRPCVFSVSGVVRAAVVVLVVRPCVLSVSKVVRVAVSVMAVRLCVFSVSGVIRVAVRPSEVIPCAKTCPEAVVAAEINVKTIIGIIGFIIRCCFPWFVLIAVCKQLCIVVYADVFIAYGT